MPGGALGPNHTSTEPSALVLMALSWLLALLRGLLGAGSFRLDNGHQCQAGGKSEFVGLAPGLAQVVFGRDGQELGFGLSH